MNGLLGKISKIKTIKKQAKSASPLRRYEVSFKAACVMPGRGAPPEWLKGQELKIEREVPDPHEIGSVYAKVLRDWEAFDNYLGGAPTLDPAPAPGEKTIFEEHLAVVGEGTHSYRLREVMI